MRKLPLLILLCLLSACGFALRGTTPLPFETLYIGIPENTLLGAQMRRGIAAASPNTRLTASARDAQASLVLVELRRTRQELALNAQGRVEEYELGIVLVFRLVDAAGRLLLPDTTLIATRDMPYDDQIVQAKEGEMEAIYRDLESSLVNRLLRRLTAPDVAAAAELARRSPEDGLPLAAPAGPAPERSPWQGDGLGGGLGTGRF